jgi:hypothetical protein
LKSKFNKKGKATIKGICPSEKVQKTFPKEIAIKMYRIVQTGPKSQLGGAHEGFFRF